MNVDSSLSQAIVDVVFHPNEGGLKVGWSPSGAGFRLLGADGVAEIGALLDRLEVHESRGQGVDAVRARTELGRRLFDALDGPDRTLAGLLADARIDDAELCLTVRLLGADGEADARHPAARWPWSSLHDGKNWLALRDGVRFALQLGPVKRSVPVDLPQAGLRILFMAYSPEGVEPVLDYEEEEERVLEALEEPLRTNRAAVHVVEDGTVDALERRLRAAEYDVVHLTGHGIMTPDGPRLVMENELGARDDVSPEVLLRALKNGRRMPALVMISSCHSAGHSGELPSLAAALVAAGVPSVVGWVRPVRDDVATLAAAELYQRLTEGVPPAVAVRRTRQRLVELGEAGSRAWPTLHLVTRDAQGFRVNDSADALKLSSPGAEATYRYLGESSQMKVLERGFVGRRRELQRGLRVLRTGRDGDRRVAGVLLHGMKGVGKSCLAARTLERHQHDIGEVGVVVLHGVLDDVAVFDGFMTLVDRWDDAGARVTLRGDEPVVDRVKRLLAGPWRERSVVIIVDDFEQNLEVGSEGAARLQPSVVALIAMLLRQCRMNRPKLLVTSTAVFEAPSGEAQSLVEVPVGSFATAATRKLWVRGKDDELKNFTPAMWQGLVDRLGRNARVIDWARTLLRGRSPEELKTVLKSAETQLKWAAGEEPSSEQQQALASLFLRTLAYERAKTQVSEDALTFVKRARVYDVAVPKSALAPLADGLSLDLERHVVALQNLGLLEVGQYRGGLAHRVSPLVEPEFDAETPKRWRPIAICWRGVHCALGTGCAMSSTRPARMGCVWPSSPRPACRAWRPHSRDVSATRRIRSSRSSSPAMT